MVFIKF